MIVQVSSDWPPSWVTIVGSATPTMVWSSAPRNSPSMTAKRISIFARWERSRAPKPWAGASSCPTGMASNRVPFARIVRRACRTGWGRTPVDRGMVGGARVGAARDLGEALGVAGELGFHRGGQVGHRHGEPVELLRVEPPECAHQDVVLDELHLVHEVEARLRRPDEDHAPVVGDADALDEPALLHPVDDPGRVRHRGVQDVGQVAHGHRVVVAQQRQDVKMGHADAEPDEPLGSGAAQDADTPGEIGKDRLGGMAPVRDGAGLDSGSHEVKYLPRTNSSVKRKGLAAHRREQGCVSR